MKIVVCYLCVTHGSTANDYAARFAATYHDYPPGIEHDTIVICNGGPLTTEQGLLFAGLKAAFWPHQNDGGQDISAYIDAAKGPCAGYDMMLCLGESNYFYRGGWLLRLAEAWQKYGPGMYGPYSSNAVRGHLNTTAFCCPPPLLQRYPVKVITHKDRYEFEHGERSLWRRTATQGMPVRLVTWDGEWLSREWRLPSNILWRGDQSNCLIWCNHADNWRNQPASKQVQWSASCDRPFK